MARKSNVKVKPAGTKLNPYEGYYLAPAVRGKSFLFHGSKINMNKLTEKDLEALAADERFGKYVKKK